MVLAAVWVQVPEMLVSVVQPRKRWLESRGPGLALGVGRLLLREVVRVVGEGGAGQCGSAVVR